MATWPSATKASTANLDSGTDSPASARADIKTNVDNVNSVIDMFNIVTPSNDQILKYSSANARFELATDSGGITDVVQDTTPQLGGNLDVNGQSIVSASNGNIAITPNGSGSIVLDGLNWPQADGSADQVLKTNGSGQLSFVTAGGGGTPIAVLRSDAVVEFTETFNETTLSQTFTEVLDASNLVTVSGHTFTITGAGTYLIQYTGNKQLSMFTSNSSSNLVLPQLTIKMKNNTDAATIYQDSFGGHRVYGTANGQSGTNNLGRIDFAVVVTIASSKTFGMTAALTSASGYNSFNLRLDVSENKPTVTISKLA